VEARAGGVPEGGRVTREDVADAFGVPLSVLGDPTTYANAEEDWNHVGRAMLEDFRLAQQEARRRAAAAFPKEGRPDG
jgi:phage portal protein BeeE